MFDSELCLCKFWSSKYTYTSFICLEKEIIYKTRSHTDIVLRFMYFEAKLVLI